MDMSHCSRPLSCAESDMDCDTSPASMLQATSPDGASHEGFHIETKSSTKRPSKAGSGSYVVDYGPVRVFHRRSTPQTLATGRRSKDEPLTGDEAVKRELRRAKNRIASRELKKARDQIEFDLNQQILELEQQKCDLQEQHKQLEARKAQLNRAVYNAKQAPLIPFVTDLTFPALSTSPDKQMLLADLCALLESIDDESCELDD